MIDFRDMEIGVVLNHWKGWLESVAADIKDGLEANGCTVHVLRMAPDAVWPTVLDLAVLGGPMYSLSPMLSCPRRLVGRQKQMAVWYTEPLPVPSWPRWLTANLSDLRCFLDRSLYVYRRSALSKAGRLRAVGEMRYLARLNVLGLLAVFTSTQQRFFGSQGLPVALIPLGYTRASGQPLGLERDIDVVFLGSTRDKRRGPLIERLRQELTAAGISIVIKDGSSERGFAFDSERVNLLNRAKISLNIMRQPWDDPVFRILISSPNGAMVLSEPVVDAGPFIPGRHFAVTSLPNIVESIRYYLANESERLRIADCCAEYVMGELAMIRMTRLFLETWYSMSRPGAVPQRTMQPKPPLPMIE